MLFRTPNQRRWNTKGNLKLQLEFKLIILCEWERPSSLSVWESSSHGKLSQTLSVCACVRACVSERPSSSSSVCESSCVKSSAATLNVPGIVLLRLRVTIGTSATPSSAWFSPSYSTTTDQPLHSSPVHTTAAFFILNQGLVVVDVLTRLCLHCHVWQMIRQLG